jgi:hypothetical protein
MNEWGFKLENIKLENNKLKNDKLKIMSSKIIRSKTISLEIISSKIIPQKEEGKLRKLNVFKCLSIPVKYFMLKIPNIFIFS